MTNHLQVPRFLKNLFLISIVSIYLPDFSINIENTYSSHQGSGGINNVRFLFPIITVLLSFFTPAIQVRYLKIFKESKFNFIYVTILFFFISCLYGIYITEGLTQQDIIKNLFLFFYRSLSLFMTLFPLIFLENINELKSFINKLIFILFIMFSFMGIIEYIAHFTYNDILVGIYDFFHSRKYASISESSILVGEKLTFFPRLSFYAAEPAFSSCLLYTLWPLALYCFLADETQKKKNKLLIFIIYLIFTLLTLSSSLFLVFPLQIIVLFILIKYFKNYLSEEKRIDTRKVLIGISAFIFFVFCIQPEFLLNNINKIRKFLARDVTDEFMIENMSSIIRSSGLMLSIKMFKMSPFLGIGQGNFLHYSKIYIDDIVEYISNPLIVHSITAAMYDSEQVAGAPNWFIRTLVETGILGLLATIYFLFNLYKYILKNIGDKAFLMSFIIGNFVLISSQGGEECFYFLLGLGNAYAYFKNIDKKSVEAF